MYSGTITGFFFHLRGENSYETAFKHHWYILTANPTLCMWISYVDVDLDKGVIGSKGSVTRVYPPISLLLTADKDECSLQSSAEEPIQWTRRDLASHIIPRVRQILTAESALVRREEGRAQLDSSEPQLSWQQW